MVCSIAPIVEEIKDWNEEREHGLQIIPEPFAPKFISPLLPIVL